MLPAIKRSFHAVLIGLISAVLSVPVFAQDTPEFRVNLIATIDNGPAMEKVEWVVYRDGTDETVKKANRHLTHVTIPAGKYTAVAKLTGDNDRTVVRKRNFYVSNNTEVVVRMD